MKTLPLITIFLLLSGCASYGVRKTTVTDPSGETWIVESQQNAVVTVPGKLIVDNQGNKTSLLGEVKEIMTLQYLNKNDD